jgi:hypothetical protein
MYGPLASPLPGLTVSPTGERCCGMRGGFMGFLGDDPVVFDTTSTDLTGGLIDPSTIDPTILDLPLPNQLSPSLDNLYPSSVGTEFTSNGDGTYTNIQTGQTVPYATAEQITAATTGAATANVDTTATGQNLNITDPNTGATSTINTNNLTVAAQALQAAGQLVNAAGKLTAQGQALLNQGNLYKAPPATGISGAMASLTTWMSGSTLFPGFPNMAVVGLAAIAAIALPALMSRKKGRR